MNTILHNLLFDYTAHCTHECESDADCTDVASDSVVGSSFTCVRDGSQSFCAPGSNTPCTNDTQCSTGELCKLGFTNVAGTLELSSVC